MADPNTFEHETLCISLMMNAAWMIISFFFVVATFRAAIDLILETRIQNDVIESRRSELSDNDN